MKWCCEGLRYLYEKRREVGIYFFVEPPLTESDSVHFWLGMRSVDLKKNDFSSYIHELNRHSILISTKIPIKHCPFCGKRLYKIYKKSFQQIVDDEIINEFHF